MTAHLLSVGDELLFGQVVNTNAAWLGRRLSDVGVTVEWIEVVGDDLGAIGRAVHRSLAAGPGALLITGGLGPTHDDLTIASLAGVLGRGLRFDETAFGWAVEKIRARGREVTDVHRRLGYVPEGFEAIPNPRGIAPGVMARMDGCLVVAMPGVPYEMEAMSEAHVLPLLRSLAGGQAVLHHTFQTVGEGETALAQRIGDPALLGDPGADVTLAFLPALGTVRVRVTARGDEAPAARALERAAVRVRDALGPAVFSEDGRPLEQVVGEMLLSRGVWIGTGESCTGGAIAARLTSIAGASRYVRGAIVAYDNAVKEDVLGVDPDVLAEHGAVSEPVALAMAAGARRVLGADVGLATTGIAGPGGGMPDKPVGTIYIAVDTPSGHRVVRHRLTPDRETNIALGTMLGLDLVRKALLKGKG